jgi:hypothetical protein
VELPTRCMWAYQRFLLAIQSDIARRFSFV